MHTSFEVAYTRFPQATTKLRPPYLGILPGLRKPIFRQVLLTVEVAFVVIENIKCVWYQPTTSTTKSQNLLSASGDRRSPAVATGWICDPSAINPIKPRLRQGRPQVTGDQSNNGLFVLNYYWKVIALAVNNYFPGANFYFWRNILEKLLWQCIVSKFCNKYCSMVLQ